MRGPLDRKNSQKVQFSFIAADRSTQGSKIMAGSEVWRWVGLSQVENAHLAGH
jgi:hypothetical protein